MNQIKCVFNENENGTLEVNAKKSGQEAWYRGTEILIATIKHICTTLKERGKTVPNHMLPPPVQSGSREATEFDLVVANLMWENTLNAIIMACVCLQKTERTPEDEKCVAEGLETLAHNIQYLNN